MKINVNQCCFIFFWLLNLAGVTNLKGQETPFQIRGKIVDASTGQALAGINVYLLDKPQKGTASDGDGFFGLTIDQLPQVIRVSSIRYYDQSLLMETSDSTFFTIRMRPEIIDLPEIAVSAEAKIDTLHTPSYSVVDYEFLEEYIFLLTYKNAIEKYHLLVLDENGVQHGEIDLKEHDPIRFFKNCLGELHLITSFKVYDLSMSKKGIQMENGIWASAFKELVNPCVLATDKFVYFSQYYFQGQALQYHTLQVGDEAVNHQLPLIEDDQNICLLLEDVGVDMPRSGNVWETDAAEDLVQIREMDYQVRGMMKVFYPKIYAPIFGRDSLIFVFNHPTSTLQYFKENGDPLFQIPIDYHRSRKWKKSVFVDEITGKAYTAFHTRWGEEIRPIYLEDGTLGKGIALNRAFVKKQKMRNGYLYFLYRNPYTGDRYTQLHKLRID